MNEPLRALLMGELDDARLATLLTDIMACTRVLRCRVKGAAAAMSSDWANEVELAFEQLVAGRLRGIQIEYVLGSEHWSDTLTRVGTTTKLVRSKLGT